MSAGGGRLAIGEALDSRSGAPAKLGVGKLSRETARNRRRDVMVIHSSPLAHVPVPRLRGIGR